MKIDSASHVIWHDLGRRPGIRPREPHPMISAHVCMNVLPMPAGAIAKAHCHEGIETIACMMEGECIVHFGPDLEKSVLVRTGEHCFVAADVPHAPQNASDQACTWLVVHSSGSDQDGIVLLPELDAQLARKMTKTT